jgi:hypothetical protein
LRPSSCAPPFHGSVFSQLLLMEGMPPAAALRLEHGDVEMIRERAQAASRAGPARAGLEGETHKFRGAD